MSKPQTFVSRKSRQTVVCRAAQENRACTNYISILTGTTKSCIRNSIIFYLKNTKVAVEVPAYQGRLRIKFEENRVKRFRDMSEQAFEFISLLFFSLSFCTLGKIAVTR